MDSIIKKIEYVSKAQQYQLYCLGDVHLGSRHSNKSALEAIIAEIRHKPYARLLLVGDLVDFILPSKCEDRFDFSEIDPDFLKHTDRLPIAIMEYLENLLGPIKDRVDIILCGNHEDKFRRKHFHDYLSVTSDKLGIFYSEFCGFVDYRFRYKDKDGFRVKLFGIHGGAANKNNYICGRIANAKIIIYGHTHILNDEVYAPYDIDSNGKIYINHSYSINCGHLAGYPKYAQKGAYIPKTEGYYILNIIPYHREIQVNKIII